MAKNQTFLNLALTHCKYLNLVEWGRGGGEKNHNFAPVINELKYQGKFSNFSRGPSQIGNFRKKRWDNLQIYKYFCTTKVKR